MCGIAGILQFKGAPLTSDDFINLKKMGHRLRYRGPDDEQIYQDGDQLAFIFRRLSIIDLKGGQQPMFDPSGQIVAMVNGEIYNYKDIKKNLTPDYPYRSHSDCEVILALYEKEGLNLVKHLIGMFAFALWDRSKGQLALVRDHLGVKPLFYTVTSKGHLLFASEIKALLAHPECTHEFDWVASLKQYSSTVDNIETSGYKDIHYLPAGSMVIIDQKEKTLKTKKWWSLPFPSLQELEKDDRTEEEVIQGYRNLLQESVHMQLMSDVGMGLALSGGIDSVSIAALASQVQKIDTFTVLNYSTFLGGDGPFAHKAAEYLGLPNHQLVLPWQSDSINYSLFKETLWAVEMPVTGEHLLKYTLYRNLKESFPNLKPLLLGQGSDEFNGGYCRANMTYRGIPVEEQNWEQFMEMYAEEKKRFNLKRYDQNLEGVCHLLDPAFISDKSPISNIDPWQYYQYCYTKSLSMYNLWFEDRIAAANSLENRVPFLDHRLVEYTTRVPIKYRSRLFWEKRILRSAIAPLLSDELTERPKGPFYRGAGERHTQRMLYNLLIANKSEFLSEAIFDNPLVKGILDLSYIEEAVMKIPDDPSLIDVDTLLMLAGRGLLAKWAKEQTEIVKEPFEQVKLEWLPKLNWENDKALIIQKLGVERFIVNELSVIGFTKETLLLTDLNHENYYIIIDGVHTHTSDPNKSGNFGKFLTLIDGQTSVGTILQKLNLKLKDILGEIDKAIENDYLEIKQ